MAGLLERLRVTANDMVIASIKGDGNVQEEKEDELIELFNTVVSDPIEFNRTVNDGMADGADAEGESKLAETYRNRKV